MMEEKIWRITWNEYTKDAYLYGSEISFPAKDHVIFKNELMPPGTVIKSWFSSTRYQSMRIEPTLPIIDGEARYHIVLEASAKPKNGLLLRILFFNRRNEEVGSRIIRDGEGDFQCPKDTFHYDIQLINGGAKEFHFSAITIAELTDEE